MRIRMLAAAMAALGEHHLAKLAMFMVLWLSAVAAQAGTDIAGPVQRVQIAADGKLWFAMDTTPAATYCKPGWHSLTMYVPKDHPEFPYYFAMLVAAASKGKSVYMANISVFDGTGPCDITKTGSSSCSNGKLLLSLSEVDPCRGSRFRRYVID